MFYTLRQTNLLFGLHEVINVPSEELGGRLFVVINLVYFDHAEKSVVCTL